MAATDARDGPPLQYDDLVMLTGLKTEALNFRLGYVLQKRKTGADGVVREGIRLLLGGETKAVREENLVHVANAAALVALKHKLPEAEYEDALKFLYVAEHSTTVFPGCSIVDCSRS